LETCTELLAERVRIQRVLSNLARCEAGAQRPAQGRQPLSRSRTRGLSAPPAPLALLPLSRVPYPSAVRADPDPTVRSRLSDAGWLRARLDAGRSVAAIAAEVGCTPRAVRYALRRHGIASPRERRTAHVSDADILDDWRAGLTVAAIAARYNITLHQVQYRVGGVPRPRPKQQRKSSRAELNDPGWLRVELALGATVASIARQVRLDRRAVRAALRRHGVAVPAAGLTRWERIEALEPDERARAAERVEAEATSIVARAMQIKVKAQREMRSGSGISRSDAAGALADRRPRTR
jgi:hypothetical protein